MFACVYVFVCVHVFVCIFVCVRACGAHLRVCVCACVRARVRVCVCASASAHGRAGGRAGGGAVRSAEWAEAPNTHSVDEKPLERIPAYFRLDEAIVAAFRSAKPDAAPCSAQLGVAE